MKNRKKFVLLISIILVVVMTATVLLVNTFSWYDRTEIKHDGETEKYNLLTYNKSGKINYEVGDSSTVTYLGTVKNGDIVYGTDAISNTSQIDVTADGPTYFKTVITNNDTSGDSVVSLYVDSLIWSENLGDTIHIGIMGPEKTYKDLTSTAQNLGKTCIEDNIILSKGTAVEIVWYVKSDAGVDGTITVGAQYPVYN